MRPVVKICLCAPVSVIQKFLRLLRISVDTQLFDAASTTPTFSPARIPSGDLITISHTQALWEAEGIDMINGAWLFMADTPPQCIATQRAKEGITHSPSALLEKICPTLMNLLSLRMNDLFASSCGRSQEWYNDGEHSRKCEGNICITFIPLIVKLEPCRLSQVVHLTINNNKLNSSTLLWSRVHGDRPRPPLRFQLFLDPPHGRRPPVVAADSRRRRTTVDENGRVAAPEPWDFPNDLRQPQ